MNIIRMQSRIEAVTVFREGAMVRRIATFRSEATTSPASLCVSNLPLAMNDASVRVRIADDDADASQPLPVAADVRVILDAPDIDDSAPPPVAGELEAARQELRRLNGRVAQAKRELARVERLIVAARPRGNRDSNEAPPPSPTSARLALLQLRQEHERAARLRLAELEREVATAELHTKQLEIRNKRATSARRAGEHELRKAVVVAVHDDREGGAKEVRVVLEYMVPGARWAPAYTVRLARDGAATFAMRAVVAQHTGEDWRDVALTLSTANAHRWTELPELSSIRIGRRQAPPKKTGWRPPPSGVQDLFRDYDRGFRYPSATPQFSVPELLYGENDTREIAVISSISEVPSTRGDSMMYDGTVDSTTILFDDAEEATVPELRPPPRSAAPQNMPAPAPMASFAAPPQQQSRGRAESRKKKRKEKSGGRRVSRARADMPSMSAAPGAGGGGAYGTAAMADDFDEGSFFDDAPFEQEERTQFAGGLTASTELLAYGDLRMPAAGAEMRGSLHKADRREVYMELLVSQKIAVSFNVLAVVAVATQRAESVASQPLPPRCRLTSDHDYDYAYRTETPVDVPSDGSFHSIALTTQDAASKLSYVVVPRQTTDVFRVVEIHNPLRAPILSGPVDVYLGKDFLLTSDVALTAPGGTMRLGLGVEQAIKVTRNTSYREETSGLLRGSLLLVHSIDIEVQNHLDRAIDCEVRERIPSTRTGEDDIEVKVDTVQPSWQRYEPESADSPESGLKGGHHWQLHLDGQGAKQTLSASYSIKIAAKYELSGGNRREA